MIEGAVALTALPQADGHRKNRPVVALRRMPPFGDWLVCGVSTQLHHLVADFDDTVQPDDDDYVASGLKASSLIRLGFLAVLPTPPRSTTRSPRTRRRDVARLHANENLPEPVVVALRGQGHDVVTMRESGQAGRTRRHHRVYLRP